MQIQRFRSSVGLEQQPSKLWVLGSNPNGITNKTKRKKHHLSNHLVLFYFLYLQTLPYSNLIISAN